MMVHFHLIPLVATLGAEEWVGRLIPTLYSIGSLAMLFGLVYHYYDRVSAVAAAVIFSLLPINLVFANMIDHEQGAIFWCIAHLFVYFKWFETRDSMWFWWAMATITFAVQFEWVGYYLALFTVIHAFIGGLADKESLLEWRDSYTFVVVYSVVVLGNAAAFFGYIAVVKGGLGEMMSSFSQRSSSPSGYFAQQWDRLFDLYGSIALSLLAIWAVWFVYRLVRRRYNLRDFAVLSFIGIQLIHSLLFKQAGHIHSYWVYYLGVAIAIGGGQLVSVVCSKLESAFLTFDSRQGSPFGRTIATLVGVLIFAPPLWLQASHAYEQFNDFRAKGGSKYLSNYDDLHMEIMWAKQLREQFGRNRDYLIHESVPTDLEFLHYLDAANEEVSDVRTPDRKAVTEKPTVFLVDLRRVGQLQRFEEMTDKYRVMLFDRRWLAIDGGASKSGFEAYVWDSSDPSIWWRWLVNRRHDPGRWSKDPKPEAARARLRTRQVASAKYFGGDGGEPLVWDCPRGSVLTGFDVNQSSDDWRGIIGMRPRCGLAGNPSRRVQTERPNTYLPFFGTRPDDNTVALKCPGDEVVKGVDGRSGLFVDALGLHCGSLRHLNATESVAPVGGDGGDPFEFRCPDGTVGTGFAGRVGLKIDAAGIRCSDVAGSRSDKQADPN